MNNFLWLKKEWNINFTRDTFFFHILHIFFNSWDQRRQSHRSGSFCAWKRDREKVETELREREREKNLREKMSFGFPVPVLNFAFLARPIQLRAPPPPSVQKLPSYSTTACPQLLPPTVLLPPMPLLRQPYFLLSKGFEGHFRMRIYSLGEQLPINKEESKTPPFHCHLRMPLSMSSKSSSAEFGMVGDGSSSCCSSFIS